MDILPWVLAPAILILISLISICLAPGIVDYNENQKMLTEGNLEPENEEPEPENENLLNPHVP